MVCTILDLSSLLSSISRLELWVQHLNPGSHMPSMHFCGMAAGTAWDTGRVLRLQVKHRDEANQTEGGPLFYYFLLLSLARALEK